MSSGFPREASDPDTGPARDQAPAGRYAHTGGQTATMVSLTHDLVVAPGRQDSLKGVSGAPVFDKASGQLLGIVVDSTDAYQNELRGLPISRLWDTSCSARSSGPPSSAPCPSRPWCLVLTAERSTEDLPGSVDGVISRYKDKDEAFSNLADTPVHVPVARGDQLGRELDRHCPRARRGGLPDRGRHRLRARGDAAPRHPSVVRRGVTVSVSSAGPDPHQDVDLQVPFNVQETRVLALNSEQFQGELRRP